MIFVTPNSQNIVVPWRQDLAQLIPHAKKFVWQGDDMLVIPNNHDEAKLCRNLGVPVPAPILTRYDWRGTAPWDIQRTTAALLTESPRAYVLSTMGTGKTRAALFAADYLLRQGLNRILIAAPLSTLSVVWEQEIFQVMMDRRCKVLHGDRAKRLRLLGEDADFYVINHHGLPLLKHELTERRFDALILDELAIFRTKGTEIWKAADALINGKHPVEYAWGLTGSPTPGAPTDAWAQIRLITPGRVARTMGQFRDQTMRKITDFKWTARPEANKLVHASMQPSVRYTRDDVMELPPTTYVNREVKLDPQADQAYKMLVKKMQVMTSNGESITAVNEGVLQGKLLQVACGFIYTDKQTVYTLPTTGRLDALDEVIDETDRKIIVFVPFIHALEGVAEYLRKKKHSVGLVYGKTSAGARNSIFKGFQDSASTPRIIVAHPQTMAHGLTLTAANTIVWYGPTQSLEIYEQANARITRPGQTSKTLIVHLSGTTVEKMTYRRLQERSKMQGVLLEMFKNQEIEY